MANTSFAYVRRYEAHDELLPNAYLVARVDGKGFHRFASAHAFRRPNDARALELMTAAATHVVRELRPEVVLAFGQSDEYSFLIRRQCELYNRRQSKLVSQIVSLFTSAYVYHWRDYMRTDAPLYPPCFDARIVVYPTEREARDYFCWRQADTHINNLYNTAFWALVQQGGATEREAHEELKGTVSADKHELLHRRFGINYDSLPALFRKGTVLAWDERGAEPSVSGGGPSSARGGEAEPVAPGAADDTAGASQASRQLRPPLVGGGEDKEGRGRAGKGRAPRLILRILHVDIIGDAFWRDAAEQGGRRARRGGRRGAAPVDGAAGDGTAVAPGGAEARGVAGTGGEMRSGGAPCSAASRTGAHGDVTPAEEGEEEEEGEGREEWERKERLRDSAGLGHRALQGRG